MGNVLYEASFKFEPAFLIIIFMIVFIPIFWMIMRKFYPTKVLDIFLLIVFVFVIAFSSIAISSYAIMYDETVGAYERGEYQTVEGYVESFNPMPYEGHMRESFEINDVEFEYSDYNIIPGYNNAKSHGGVIRGDNQHLKIGYVYFEKYGNVIVYIEELESE